MPASTREAPLGVKSGGISLQSLLDKMTSRNFIRGILLISLLPMTALATWGSVARLQVDHAA